jgi:dolichol-phosphate mannosyltransferase
MLPFRAVSERHLLWLAMLPGVWLCATMPVFAQESYYWAYAQHPALSYFDHPPMVAWMIWLGTQAFGDGALGIRLLTLLCGCANLLAGHALLAAFGAGEGARRAWLLFASCAPILMMTRFLANPDPPLVAFWLLCMFALWQARSGSLRWWLVAGLCAGGALLSKYSAAFLAPAGLLLLVFDPAMRRQWRRPGPWLGVAVAAVVFSPVVVWNVRNGGESIAFQTTERWSNGALTWRWLCELVGGQIGVFNPVIAVLLPAAVLWLLVRARGRDGAPDVRALWLLAFGLPLPLYMLGNAAFMLVKINWLAPAYPALLLGLSLWWDESDFCVRHPVGARRLGLALASVLVIVPLAPLIRLYPQPRGSSWAGWSELAACAEKWEEKIDPEDGIEGNVFFFAADYKDASQLTRHLHILDEDLPPAHALEPILAQNVLGERALQFDHWSQPSSHLGQDAIFVLPRATERGSVVDKVKQHFASVEMVEEVSIDTLGFHLMTADIYVCRAYRGPLSTH